MRVALIIKRVILEKFYGPFIWAFCCAALDCVWMVVDAYLPFEVCGAVYVENALWISAAMAVVCAIGYSFWTGRVGRAFGQILISFVMAIALMVALICMSVCTQQIAIKNRGPEKGWWSVGPNKTLPFAVEYRSMHGFLAEYERRITFQSGRHVNLQTDTGGAGAFAVYELGPNEFYLVDGLDHAFIRSEYHVDVLNEKVEQRDEDCEWVQLPIGDHEQDETLKWFTGSDEIEDKKRSSVVLNRRRYLGKICPSGRFEAGGLEPDVDDVGMWVTAGFSSEIPFAYEWNGAEKSRRNSRIAFASGRRVGLMWNDKKPQDVYKMKDGRFLLDGNRIYGGHQLHCVDVENEAVYFAGASHWVRVPDDAIGIRTVREEEAGERRPAQAVMTAFTERGRVRSVGSDLVGDPLADSVYVGTLYPNGTIARRK